MIVADNTPIRSKEGIDLIKDLYQRKKEIRDFVCACFFPIKKNRRKIRKFCSEERKKILADSAFLKENTAQNIMKDLNKISVCSISNVLLC